MNSSAQQPGVCNTCGRGLTIVFSQADCSIVIRGGSSYAIAVIKSIRSVFKLGLKESKDLWDASVKTGVIRGTREQCEALSKQLTLDRVAHDLKQGR